MGKKYFGTDGIRGVAGEPPLDPATVYAIGTALASRLLADARVLIGTDTRESSGWIAETLAQGLRARGVAVEYAGVVPTPAVAYLTRHRGLASGVVVSASHNPFEDNGIKAFGPNGYKLPDADEAAVEAALQASGPAPRAASPALREDPTLRAEYLGHLCSTFAATDFSGLRLVLDCAHGAAAPLAEQLCSRLGLRATIIAAAPDGRNINAGVGALHPEALARTVVSGGYDLGVALDGDADRAMFVDAHGAVVNGDCVLWMAARDLLARGELVPALVVGTVMTNLGLELALAAEGIALHRTAVGDKYVLERMRESGAALGGEPSGHVIFAREATTGDGLLTALHCLALAVRSRRPLRDLCSGWSEYPQRIVNVPVERKPPLEEVAPVQAAIQEAERHFRGAGRILVRYSGTERLARVMVEAESEEAVVRYVERIADAVRQALGTRASGNTAVC